MEGTDFEQSNAELGAPAGMEGRVYTLPVYRGDGQVVSKWEMTWQERLHCLFRGYAWLSIMGGNMPPARIDARKLSYDLPGGMEGVAIDRAVSAD